MWSGYETHTYSTCLPELLFIFSQGGTLQSFAQGKTRIIWCKLEAFIPLHSGLLIQISFKMGKYNCHNMGTQRDVDVDTLLMKLTLTGA